MNIEDQLRDALAAHAGAVPPAADRWDEVERGARRRRNRRRALTSVSAGVAATAIAVVAIGYGSGGGSGRRVTSTGPAATSPLPTVSTPPVPATGGPATSPSTTAVAGFAYQPLWPFRDAAEARDWQTNAEPGGHSPWHLDAVGTASFFVENYLGFSDVNTVVRVTNDAQGAHVAMGYVIPSGKKATAAVVHLVRMGTGSDAPWEVVGTDDDPSSFTITQPRYGSLVTSPVVVGGSITGVDESIHVRMLTVGETSPLGDSCCNPAGGDQSPWGVTVTFRPGHDRVATIVAATGGHLQTVERFVVTGVRIAASAA